MAETNPRGRFVWHELMTTDPEAAITFYPGVTGWGVQPFEQDPSYRMWTVNGAPIGGVLPISDDARAMGARPYWLPYIGTADIEEATSHAVRLGATVYVPATPIAVGVFSVLRDPQGATFALFESAGPMPGHEGVSQVGEFSWHELRTSDGEAAWRFYSALCGWNETGSMDMGPMGKYRMFGRNGIELGGMYNKPERVAGPPAWLSYVRIPSTDRSVARATALGGRVTNGPMEVPGGNYIAELCDNREIAFAVHEERENVAVTTPKPKAKAKGNAKPKAKVKAKPKSKPKAKPKSKPKSKPKVKSKAKSKPKTKAKSKASPARRHR